MTRPATRAATELTLDRKLLSLIWPYIRREKVLYLLCTLLLPFSVLLPLTLPRTMKVIIDDRLPGGVGDDLVRSVLVLVALVAINLVVQTVFQYLLRLIGMRIMRNLRRDLFARLQRLELEFFRREPRGRVVARLTTDLEQIDQMFASGGLLLISDLLSTVAITVAILDLSLPLGLAGLAVVPVMFAFTSWLGNRMRRVARELRTQTAQMNGFAQESLSAHDVISVMAARDRFASDFDGLASTYQETSMVMNRYESAFFSMVDFFGSLAGGCVLIAASGGASLTAGILIAMIQYIQQFFVPLRGLATRFSSFQQALVALERVQALFALPVEPLGGEDLAPVVEIQGGRRPEPVAIRHVDFAYRPDKPVLRAVDLEIPAGAHVALLGETGSGKSTLARMLMGFYRPSAGHLDWGGHDLGAMPLERRRSLVTLVPQEVFLFDATILENITLGRSIPQERLREVITAVGLDETWLRELETGASAAGAMGTERNAFGGGLGEWGRRLSEGEKQLLAAARVILYDPALVVLDEATSALDPISDARVRAAIRRALEGRSALIIAHRLSTLQSADSIAVLHRGHVVEHGTHEELSARGGVYAKLYRLMELGDIQLALDETETEELREVAG